MYLVQIYEQKINFITFYNFTDGVLATCSGRINNIINYIGANLSFSGWDIVVF